LRIRGIFGIIGAFDDVTGRPYSKKDEHRILRSSFNGKKILRSSNALEKKKMWQFSCI
jgi:hypothetical protein